MANPPAPNVTLWRNLIGMLYNHPGIVTHPEMLVLQNLFLEMGTSLQGHAIQIRIPVDENQFNGPQDYARPIIFPPNQPLQLIFGDVEECQLDPERKEMVVSKYTLCASLRIGMSEMVDFIRRMPEALYYEMYAFMLDFLLRFGIPAPNIEKYVTDSKIKRETEASYQVFPADVESMPGQSETIELKYEVPVEGVDPETATSTTTMLVPPGSFILKTVKWENDASFPTSSNPQVQGQEIIYATAPVTQAHPTQAHPNQVGDYSKLQLQTGREVHVTDNGSSSTASNNQPPTAQKTYKEGGSGPTMCPICELTFSRRRSMLQHLRSKHPDQAPPKPIVQKKLQTKHIKCPCCETHFTYRRSLVFHLRQKHPGHELPGVKSYSRVDVERRKRVDCPHPLCTVRFTRKSSMIHHFKHKHPNDTLPQPPSTIITPPCP